MKYPSTFNIFILTTAVASIHAKNAKTMKQWESCRDKTLASIKIDEVGALAIEEAVQRKCGNQPITKPNLMTRSIGISPYNLVRSQDWKEKFKAVTSTKYSDFVERLTTTSVTTMQDNFILGIGYAPHLGRNDAAIFAINSKTGKIFAAMLEEESEFTTFGFDSWDDAPKCIKDWHAGDE